MRKSLSKPVVFSALQRQLYLDEAEFVFLERICMRRAMIQSFGEIVVRVNVVGWRLGCRYFLGHLRSFAHRRDGRLLACLLLASFQVPAWSRSPETTPMGATAQALWLRLSVVSSPALRSGVIEPCTCRTKLFLCPRFRQKRRSPIREEAKKITETDRVSVQPARNRIRAIYLPRAAAAAAVQHGRTPCFRARRAAHLLRAGGMAPKRTVDRDGLQRASHGLRQPRLRQAESAARAA